MQHLFQQLRASCPERADALIKQKTGNPKVITAALRRMIVALGGSPFQGKNSGVANLWLLIKLIGGQPKLDGQSFCGADYVFPRAEVIGRGGFATVYRSGNRALKCLDSKRKRDGEQEVRVLARLQHPNILQLVDWWYSHGNLVIVTELIQGQSLRTLQGRVAKPQLLRMGEQLFQALAYMHSLGYVHRDVKPSNAMWSSSTDQLKLLDLGLATESNRVFKWSGTLAYMLPQIWRWHFSGQPYATELLEQADVWSACATLFTLMLRRPYDGVKQADELKEIFAKTDAEIVNLFGWNKLDCSVPWLQQRLCALTDQPSAAEALAAWSLLVQNANYEADNLFSRAGAVAGQPHG